MIVGGEWQRTGVGTRQAKVHNAVIEGNNVKLRNQHVVVLDNFHESVPADGWTDHGGTYAKLLYKQLV